MPVSGVVITLSDQPDAPFAFASACHDDDRVMLGDRTKNRWPIVLETQRADETDQLHHWLLSLPVVQAADVVYVAFDEPSPRLNSPQNPSSMEPRP